MAGRALRRSDAIEITTAPTRARTRPTTPRRMCHPGLLQRSSSRSVPIAMPTIGFATDTVATDGASFPVPSETCWRTKPSTPATASA